MKQIPLKVYSGNNTQNNTPNASVNWFECRGSASGREETAADEAGGAGFRDIGQSSHISSP
jgi:hypothetical protein